MADEFSCKSGLRKVLEVWQVAELWSAKSIRHRYS